MNIQTTRITKKEKLEITAKLVTEALAEYFGGIAKEEATEVFKVMAMMSKYPGVEPPEPLVGCSVLWTSEIRVGETLASQIFSVQAKYKQVTFNYSERGGGLEPIRGMQLPDSSSINFDNWDLHSDRVEKRTITNIKF